MSEQARWPIAQHDKFDKSAMMTLLFIQQRTIEIWRREFRGESLVVMAIVPAHERSVAASVTSAPAVWRLQPAQCWLAICWEFRRLAGHS